MKTEITEEAEQNIRQLAGCILDFVMELEGYRRTCIKHDKSTSVTLAKNGTLWLRKQYKRREDFDETVRRMLDVLEDWEKSPWWHKWDTWDDLKKRTERQEKPLLCRGVHWEGWPMLVCITVSEDIATVATSSPAVGSEHLPELPIRKAAMALKCHEHLVPEWLAGPEVVECQKGGDYPLHAYLKRTWKDKEDPVYEMIHKWPK